MRQLEQILTDLNPRYDLSDIKFEGKNRQINGFVDCDDHLHTGYALIKSFARGGIVGFMIGSVVEIFQGYYNGETAYNFGVVGSIVDIGAVSLRFLYLRVAQYFNITKYMPQKPKEIS